MIECTFEKELHGVGKSMLLDIQLIIEKHSFTAIYGESGAGKTTLFRILAGLTNVNKGNITFNGVIWQDTEKKVFLPTQKRSIGFVFQDFALFPNMTVYDNLKYALQKGQNQTIIDELIEITELGDLKNRKPENLSGGQKQRVALARAIVPKPELLLLDEPLSALDNEMRSKLQDYISEIHKEFQLTTLMITHDVGEIVKLANNVIQIQNGKIVRQGSIEEIFLKNDLSGKFQFIGELLQIQNEGVVNVLTILIGTNLVKIISDPEESLNLNIGDKVIVASKAFNPVVQKIEY